MGWALYLPEDWCEDAERRAKAKIPEEVVFKTKPELGVELVERAAGWEVPAAPVLGDQAYGDNTALRDRLHEPGVEYVLSVGAADEVFAPRPCSPFPSQRQRPGRPKSRVRGPTASPRRSAT